MADLIRFGVSIEEKLLGKFDALIHKKNYANRSEAIRDLMRAALVEQEWKDETAEAIGTVNIVYDHHINHLSRTLMQLQHDCHELIVSTTHVHLDHDNCLDVVIVRGRAGRIKQLADALISAKGVKFGKLTMATKGKELQ